MLQNILQNLWNMVGILFCIALITFIIVFIVNYIALTIDEFKHRKIKDEALKRLQQDFDTLVKEMDKEKQKDIDKEPKE